MTPVNQKSPDYERKLTMTVYDIQCKCGNQWVHSSVTYSNGGHPLEKDVETLEWLLVDPVRRQVSRCHRCVPLGLPLGWAAVYQTHYSAAAVKPPSALDLLKRIK